MSFTKHYFEEDFINEMLIKGKRKTGEPEQVIAFNKWIYFLDDEAPDWGEVKQEIVANLNLEDKMDDTEGMDMYDFKQTIAELVPDVLIGSINGDELNLDGYAGFKLDPQSSILIKKVVKQLGIDSVEYPRDEYGGEYHSKWEIKGKIPDVAYHGTTTEYLEEISRIGLRPGAKESNWMKQYISHPDKIFFATRFDEAMNHAQMTAGKRGGYPMVVEFKIPNKDLIVPDYDVEVQTGHHADGDSDIKLYYTYIDKPFPKEHDPKTHKEKPLSVSKEFGVYGYKGVVPPKFIQSYWVAIGKEPEEVYGKDDYTEYDAGSDIQELKQDLGLEFGDDDYDEDY